MSASIGLSKPMISTRDVIKIINKRKREMRKKRENDGYGIDRMVGNYVIDSQIRALNYVAEDIRICERKITKR